MVSKCALITGITGQDGSYLAEFLLSKGYRVIGMTRRSSTDAHERIESVLEQIEIVSGDLLDQSSMTSVLAQTKPDEVYNLAAQSFVPASWSQPVLTGEFTALGVTRIMEAIRHVNPRIKFYQASSSEMFGKVLEVPQKETTPFYPRSPYGVAKVYGHWITVNYRESYDMFAVSGISRSTTSRSRKIRRLSCDEEILSTSCRSMKYFTFAKRERTYRIFETEGLEVWDGNEFVQVLGGTAYKHRPVVDNKAVRRVEARCGSVTLTANHVMFTSSGSCRQRT